MFVNVFEYVDKIMGICKPKKLLYMAVDGVAPTAKINQQRTRRFRGALDKEVAEEVSHQTKGEWREKGITYKDEREEKMGKQLLTN